MRKLLPQLFIAAFVVMALFGVFLTAPLSHDAACPFIYGCVAAIEHLVHWQGAFAVVLAETLILVAAAAVLFVLRFAHAPESAGTVRWRQREMLSERPTLMQELFSRGILHRKEPHTASVRFIRS